LRHLVNRFRIAYLSLIDFAFRLAQNLEPERTLLLDAVFQRFANLSVQERRIYFECMVKMNDSLLPVSEVIFRETSIENNQSRVVQARKTALFQPGSGPFFSRAAGPFSAGQR
jgi:hypothetical protein